MERAITGYRIIEDIR